FIFDGRAADVVAGREESVDLPRRARLVVRKRVRIPSFMAFEPVTAAVKLGCAALAGNLHLGARIAAEFRALPCRGHFAFGNRIHADAIRKLLVDTGVRNGLSIDREIVLGRALAVERRRPGNSVRRCTRYSFEETREITAVERDIHNLSSSNDAGTLG